MSICEPFALIGPPRERSHRERLQIEFASPNFAQLARYKSLECPKLNCRLGSTKTTALGGQKGAFGSFFSCRSSGSFIQSDVQRARR
jgi:hypothetical protein